jgi:glycine dehydrogenase
LGQGFYGTITPPVILRNMLQNPGWYTAYTPYQAEISQGRMEMLLNFQTMICDLTGMQISNASVLDEATAAAEALSMCHALHEETIEAFFVDNEVHPSTADVVRSRASVLGIEVVRGDAAAFDFDAHRVCGALLQYPGTTGVVRSDLDRVIQRIHDSKAKVVVATDLLALTLLRSPGSLGADITVGSAQRFGVPMSCGGPHAGFVATNLDYARRMPGRIMGVSIDRERGLPAIRMALQTREQHIRREKATSNICTAQALLANMAASYAIYHGPQGLTAIAERVHTLTEGLRLGLGRVPGLAVSQEITFDTVSYELPVKGSAKGHLQHLRDQGYNVRPLGKRSFAIALDETITEDDIDALIAAVRQDVVGDKRGFKEWSKQLGAHPPRLLKGNKGSHLRRTDAFLTYPTFNSYHSETEMMRYLFSLQQKDLALNSAMIPLGSCTMKLNAASEMIPVTWPELSSLHPFAPKDQMKGTFKMVEQLTSQLASITGFDAVSLQPNSGAAGEYAGLRAIRAYQHSVGEGHRDVCLIPTSAHGTNPASAAMAGLKIVQIKCGVDGYVDLAHLREQATRHSKNLSCVMITYPSTYGVFEENIRETIAIVKEHGGQIYMDGANMNAQVGLTSPGFLGADVCHLNLHKTFCIPHGGGGPGVGPICVRVCTD